MTKPDIRETTITRFDGGMTSVLRGSNKSLAKLIQNFDIYTDPSRMIPNPDFTTDIFDTGLSAATVKLCKFLPATNAAGNGTIQFALGITVGQTNGLIYLKSVAAGGTWVVSSGGFDGVLNENLFVEYQGRIYAANATMVQSYNIAAGSYDTAGGGTTSVTLNHTGIFQGVVHSKADVLYIPYYTVSSGVTSGFIASKNGTGAFNATALSLPKNMIPISICEYGNYLAIALKPANVQSKKSVVLLWDRDSSLTTVTESIDWGYEALQFIQELDGELVGVSTYANTSSETITTRPRLIFKHYYGGPTRAKQFLELALTSSIINNSSTLAWDVQKINNRVFFMASVEIDSVRKDAIFSIAKKDNGELSVSIDRLLNNDTAITSCIPKGFLKFGEYMVVGYTNNGTYVTNVTVNGAATYTASAIFETTIFNTGNSSVVKKLLGTTVMTKPITASGEQVVLSYQKDAETSPTTIFTNTTVTAGSFVAGTTYTIISVGTTDFTLIGASANTVGVVFVATGVGTGTGVAAADPISHHAINIESTGVTLPEYRESTFKITSTGGANITGLIIREEIIDK